MDENNQSAFFYGTLMAPEVFFTVCYNTKFVPDQIWHLHTFTPAILHGYSRHRVRDADYPGIIPDKEDSAEKNTVLGTLVTGLTKANLGKLDDFEGSEYERRRVTVKVLKEVGNAKGEGNVEGEEREVDTYIFLDDDRLEDREWDFEEFRKEKMANWTRAGLLFDDEENPRVNRARSPLVWEETEEIDYISHGYYEGHRLMAEGHRKEWEKDVDFNEGMQILPTEQFEFDENGELVPPKEIPEWYADPSNR